MTTVGPKSEYVTITRDYFSCRYVTITCDYYECGCGYVTITVAETDRVEFTIGLESGP
mgnify:CR=1 FL=1